MLYLVSKIIMMTMMMTAMMMITIMMKNNDLKNAAEFCPSLLLLPSFPQILQSPAVPQGHTDKINSIPSHTLSNENIYHYINMDNKSKPVLLSGA